MEEQCRLVMSAQPAILIVARGDQYRKLYASIARHLGYEAISSQGVAEAKGLLARGEVVLVVVDLDPWLEDGTVEEDLEMLGEETGSAPIVAVLSRHLADEMRARPPQLRGLVYKPFLLAEFEDVVRAALEPPA